jgi:hypothetical protein
VNWYPAICFVPLQVEQAKQHASSALPYWKQHSRRKSASWNLRGSRTWSLGASFRRSASPRRDTGRGAEGEIEAGRHRARHHAPAPYLLQDREQELGSVVPTISSSPMTH